MSQSTRLLERARQVIPGGVNSPVRAFKAVGGDPPFIARGEGAEIIDVDGHRYVDLVCSWGALLLGHADNGVLGATIAAASRGSSFGAPTEGEVELAELLCKKMDSVEKVRLVSSGTEATMHALRLARGVTGRERIIKIEGCYHGAHDAMLVQAGSGLATFNVPGSPGVPAAVAESTLLAPFNNLDAINALLENNKDQVAALIVEPVAGNMGCIPPKPGYLEGLRELSAKHGAILIFDEVMSGFRVGETCAQGLYGVTPDLSCFGKIVGGGYPLAAFGGRGDLMDQLAPVGNVYQAGTLSGNPVAVAAGLATLKRLDHTVYDHIEAVGTALEEQLRPGIDYHGCSMHRVGGMFTIFFRETAPNDFDEVKTCDFDAFGRFFRAALNGGVYLPPSQYEAAFLSHALTERHVETIVGGINAALVAAHI